MKIAQIFRILFSQLAGACKLLRLAYDDDMDGLGEQLNFNGTLPRAVCRLDASYPYLQDTVVTQVGLAAPDYDFEEMRQHLKEDGEAGIRLVDGVLHILKAEHGSGPDDSSPVEGHRARRTDFLTARGIVLLLDEVQQGSLEAAARKLTTASQPSRPGEEPMPQSVTILGARNMIRLHRALGEVQQSRGGLSWAGQLSMRGLEFALQDVSRRVLPLF